MTREEAIILIERAANELREMMKTITMPTSAAEQLQQEIDAHEIAISALRQQETVIKCHDLFDEDGGEITHVETVTNRNGLKVVEIDQIKPLTLDELRQMAIREWVWIEVFAPAKFRSKETESAYYRKYDGYRREEIFWCGYPGIGFGFDYADYETTWIAYRQKPEDGTV